MPTTETGYLIVRDDYSTFTSDGPPSASVDASVGNTITAPDYPLDTWSDIVDACNAVVEHYWQPADHAGQPRERLVQISYDNPDDTAVSGSLHPHGPGPFVLPDPLKRDVIRADVVAE